MGERCRRAMALGALGLVLLGIAGFSPNAAYAAKGEDQYKAGRVAEDRREYDEALRQYTEAMNQDPRNPQYVIAVERVRLLAGATHVERGYRLREQGALREALAEFEMATALDPGSPVARQEAERTRTLIEEQEAGVEAADEGMLSAEEALGPPQLKPLSRAPISLRMTNDSKIVFETIGKLAGVNVLLDPDYVTKRITVELNNVSLEQALDEVSVSTKTFWKPLSQNTILIVPDTAVKRREQEQQILKTFYLSNTITPQELTEVVTAIRTLLETRRIQQINSMNAIIIRDTPDKVAIAEKIIRDVDKAKPEVVVDVAVLEVRRDKARQLGLFPTAGGSPGISISAGPTPRDAATGEDTTSNAVRLNRLGTLSSADWSVTLPGAQLNALLTDSKTKILQRPEVRASDGQKATLRIGDRVPIATGAFQPGVAGQVVSALVQTQFQYIDVGVNLDITPKMHANHEITLNVRVEISAVTQQVEIGGIRQPVIGQRIIEHAIRLREGEMNVLGGILQTQSTQTVSGIPGLSQIPLLKYLFSNVNDTVAEDEVLIVLRPHAIRRPDITALNLKALDIGTEGDVRLRSPSVMPEESPEPSGEPAPGTAEPGGARLRFQNPNLIHQAGETFEVALEIEDARDASSIPLEISYDTGTLKLVRIANGDFLGRDGQPVAVVERADEVAGKTAVTLSRPPATEGASGSGTLAVLTFQAAQAGTTTLGILPEGIQNAAQRWLPLQGAQATVTIR